MSEHSQNVLHFKLQLHHDSRCEDEFVIDNRMIYLVDGIQVSQSASRRELYIQEKQKKEAAAASGKGVKQSAGELRLQKGQLSAMRLFKSRFKLFSCGNAKLMLALVPTRKKCMLRNLRHCL